MISIAAREPILARFIRTKLNRPPVAADSVCRDRLHIVLEAGRNLPLTLVSAPAGYGKSTLVAQQLESGDRPSAWLSLDAADSDIRVFVGYVVAAIRTVFPEACETALDALEANDLPPPSEIAAWLSNDLDGLEKSFVLVLDDYHRIRDAAIHELLDALLQHPPPLVHLVIISRRDPPLSLGTLRAHGWLNEIRMGDLQFTEGETATFIQQATGYSVSAAALGRLHESTEGWAVGLRLAALALRHRSDIEEFVRGLSGDTRQVRENVREYLVAEVLSHQPSAVRDWLYRTSILDRFCAPLCEAVCERPFALGEDDEGALNGAVFVERVERAGLFCVALDGRDEWYRYHHLFQELLYRQLETLLAPDEIKSLHRRAATWLGAQGLLDEAFHHALKSDGPAEAGRLLVGHRNDILNAEQWHRLGRWLNRLPAGVVEDDPELAILRAWRLQNQGRHVELPVLDRIERLLSCEPANAAATTRLRGAIDALRGYQHYNAGQAELAVKCAEQALTRLPPDCLSERGYAFMVLGGALRTSGDLPGARKVLFDALADTSVPMGTFQGRLLMTLCLVNWVAADLASLRLTARQYFELGEGLGLAESIMNARHFLGVVQYQQNELSKAESSLISVVSDRWVPNPQFFTESAFVLASVYEAKGRADQATELIESVCEYLLRVRNTTVLQRAQAYQADLALREGRMAEAVDWAQRFDPEPFRAMYRFYEPRMTLVRVLVTEGSAQSLERAAGLLTRLEAFLAGIHNIRFLIEVLALQALLRDAQGDESAARDLLGRAISLAQPGGFIRLFVDLGPALVRPLNRLELDEEGLQYVGRILAAFNSDGGSQAGEAFGHERPVSAGRQALPEALTQREREILGMLAARLSNKEISDRLCIAPATVKRHTEHIYEKLGVHGRKQAVAKALGLAILRPP